MSELSKELKSIIKKSESVMEELENRIEIDSKLTIEDVIKDLEEIRDKYFELIMQVESKYPNESRHETALRYIREAEKRYTERVQFKMCPTSLRSIKRCDCILEKTSGN